MVMGMTVIEFLELKGEEEEDEDNNGWWRTGAEQSFLNDLID